MLMTLISATAGTEFRGVQLRESLAVAWRKAEPNTALGRGAVVLAASETRVLREEDDRRLPQFAFVIASQTGSRKWGQFSE